MKAENIEFYCKSRDETACARGFLDGDCFLVCKGSRANGNPNRFVQQGLLEDGVLKSIGHGLFEFVCDYVFRGPSPAAATVLGYSVNGWKRWKDKLGRCLEDIAQRGD